MDRTRHGKGCTAVGLYLALASPRYFMMPELLPPVMKMGLRERVPYMRPFIIISLSVDGRSNACAPPVTEMITCTADT